MTKWKWVVLVALVGLAMQRVRFSGIMEWSDNVSVGRVKCDTYRHTTASVFAVYCVRVLWIAYPVKDSQKCQRSLLKRRLCCPRGRS